MQEFMRLLDELKAVKTGDKKSDYADLLWQINDRMELILAHFGFDPDSVETVDLFKESSDVRLEKLKARIQKQKEEPAASLVDAVNGGIKLINQMIEQRFGAYVNTSFNMVRRVFEVEIHMNIWGESSLQSKPSERLKFNELLQQLREEGFILETGKSHRQNHVRLVDMTQNRQLLESSLTEMFNGRGIQYEVRGDEITEIKFIVRPQDLPLEKVPDDKENEKPYTTDLSEDEVTELTHEISNTKGAVSMLSYDQGNRSVYLSVLRSCVSQIEEIMGCEDLSICRGVRDEHRAEREKNLEIHRLEQQAQAETISLLKDEAFYEDIQKALSRYVGIELAPLRLSEFYIREWNSVEMTLAQNRMPYRDSYEGHLDCIFLERDRYSAAIFEKYQVEYICSLLRAALPSVELVSAKGDYRQDTPLLEQMTFRLNDPCDFVELMKHVPEKKPDEDDSLWM